MSAVVHDSEQAARDLAESLRACAAEGDDFASIELEGQLAKYPWLAIDDDRAAYPWLRRSGRLA
jgi:hypothetical protein